MPSETLTFIDQPAYPQVQSGGELIIVEGPHVDGEDLLTPYGVTIFPTAPDGSVRVDFVREIDFHDHWLSVPSEMIQAPEPSIFASLMCGVVLLEGLRRRKKR